MQILTGGGEAAGVEEVGEAVEVAGVGAVECRLPTSTFYFSI